jgi:hypothetical protein
MIGTKGLRPGALCVMFARGTECPRQVSELGLRATLEPGEVSVEATRGFIHGNSVIVHHQ